jgi:uncharacterized protein (TIGR02757 family)
MRQNELKDFLDEKVEQYNSPSFIETDPISIPHLFTKKEDIEIAGLFAASLAWGQRSVIIKNSKKLMEWMDYEPHQFVLMHQENDLHAFHQFTHRTFNGDDCVFFLRSLRNIYQNHGGLEKLFLFNKENIKFAISNFRETFLIQNPSHRAKKHISNPMTNSACKRLNMFLRWMVRKDTGKVDFGIWQKLHSENLMCPLDIHVGRVARKLGLLVRKQNDWKAVEELTQTLKKFDSNDPVKYDFALFGLGLYEDF